MSILPDPANGVAVRLPERADPAAVIAYLDAIKAGLELVETVDEAHFYVEKADLIRYLADKAKLSDEIRMTAETVAFKARQHAGRLLAALPRPNGRPPQGGESAGFRYVDLGVPERDARRWQEDAAIPPQVVDSFAAERLASGKAFSRSALHRWAQAEDPDNGALVHEHDWQEVRILRCHCGANKPWVEPTDPTPRFNWVLEHSEARREDRLALLAYAWCLDMGEEPTDERVARLARVPHHIAKEALGTHVGP